MKIASKLPKVGTTIFTVMSKMAQEYGAINLAQGFPNFDCSEKLRERVSFHMNRGKNQYAPMAGVYELREQLSKKLHASYNIDIDPDSEITITAGATQAIFTGITAFVKKDDEVVIIEPAYDCYRPVIELLEAKVIPYKLEAPNFSIDWDKFSTLVSEKTKMIIINTPHNPTGKILSREDLLSLQKIIQDKNIIVLSDEVYEHLIFDRQEHESVLKFTELYQKSMAVYSFGKTFHNTGWKTGYCVAPKYIMEEFRKVHQFNVFSVNSFVQYGLADFLQDENQYLSLPSFYQQKRDYFNTAMQGSKLKALSSAGTYFQLYDYSAISNESDIDFVEKMTKDYGVAAIPISAFYSDAKQTGCIRLCFAKDEGTLGRAAELLSKI